MTTETPTMTDRIQALAERHESLRVAHAPTECPRYCYGRGWLPKRGAELRDAMLLVLMEVVMTVEISASDGRFRCVEVTPWTGAMYDGTQEGQPYQACNEPPFFPDGATTEQLYEAALVMALEQVQEQA